MKKLKGQVVELHEVNVKKAEEERKLSSLSFSLMSMARSLRSLKASAEKLNLAQTELAAN